MSLQLTFWSGVYGPCLGFTQPARMIDSVKIAGMLSMILGGGMSSRLFQEVRENRGLCYSIYSSAWGLRDGGMFGIHAATGREVATELAEAVAVELRKCASGDLTDKEVQDVFEKIQAQLQEQTEYSIRK